MKKTLLLSLAGIAMAFSANADRYWIFGEIFGGGWSPTELKLNSATGKYETNGVLQAGKFGIRVTSDDSDGSNNQTAWYSAPKSASNIGAVGTYKIANSDNTDFSSNLVGNYSISLDWNSKELTFANYDGPIDETVSYVLRGAIFGGTDWADKEMTEADGAWSWTGNVSAGSFGIKKMVGSSQDDWVYGPKGNSKISATGTYDAVSEKGTTAGENWTLDISGELTFSFNPETMVLTLTGEAEEIVYAKIYIPVSDWQKEKCYIYSWNPELFGGWPGTEMTKVTEDNLSGVNATSYWMLEIPETTIKNKAVDGWKLNAGNGGAESSEVTNGTVFKNDYVYHLDGTSHLLGEHPDDNNYTNVYLINSVKGLTVGPNTKMATEDGVTYTYTLADAPSTTAFKVVVGDKYYGLALPAGLNMQNGEYTLPQSTSMDNMTLDNGGDSVDFTVTLGENTVTLTISGQTPRDPDGFAPIYLVSSKINNSSVEQNQLQTTDGKVYTITMPNFSGDLPFHFLSDDEHKHIFSNGQQNMKNGEYELPVIAEGALHGEMTLDNGGDVTFTFTLAEDHNSATLEIAGQEAVVDEFPRMYFVGVRTEWLTTEPYRMTTTNGKVYTITVPDVVAGKQFRFTGDSWNVRSMGGPNLNNLGNVTVDLVNSQYNLTLKKGGNVTFTLEFPEALTADDLTVASATLTIAGQDINGDDPVDPDPEVKDIYLVGAMTDNFNIKDDYKMDYADGKYTITKQIAAGAAFKFTTANWENEFTLENGSDLTNGEYVLTKVDWKNMTLKYGGNVTFTLVPNEDYTSAELTIAGQEEGDDPIDDYLTLYLVGDLTGGWTVNEDYKMTTTDGNVYKYTGKLEGGKGFKIWPGNWDNSDENFGGAGTDLGNGTFDIYADGGDMTLKYGGDNVTITLDIEAKKLTIAGQDEEIVVEKVVTYGVHGNFASDTWETTVMEEESETAWSCVIKVTNEGANFGVKKMENNTQVEWYCAPVTFSLSEPNHDLVLNGSGNCAFDFPVSAEKIYKFTFDPTTKSLNISDATGVDSIIANDGEAVYFNLQGVKIERPESGLYIEVRQGQSRKVMVK